MKTDSDSDKEFADAVESILKFVIRSSYAAIEADVVARALLGFLVRSGNTWRSIRVLHDNAKDSQLPNSLAAFMLDAAALKRAMIDAYLQAAFIFYQDKGSQIEFATDYFEFSHVESYTIAGKAISHDTEMSRSLQQSADRPTGEKRLQSEYDRVKPRYTESRLKNGKPKFTVRHDKWYKGSLRNLAEEIAKKCEHNTLAEYDFFVAQYNGSVHSSALAVQKEPIFPPEYTTLLASKIVARIVDLNVKYQGVKLSEVSSAIVGQLCNSPLNYSDG